MTGFVLDSQSRPETLSNWKTVQLRHVLKGISNGTTQTQVDSETAFPVTRIETISAGAINRDRVGYVDYDPSLARYLLHPGDILFSHINSLECVGNCAMFEGGPPLYSGMNLLRLRPNSTVAPRFLLHWLKSDSGKRQFQSIAKHAINQVSIPIGSLKAVRLPYPPLDQQCAIANFLDREIAGLDALMKSKTSLIDRFHEKRRCYIAEVCLRGLDGSSPSKASGIPTVGQVPRHWTVVRNKVLFREIDERSVDGTEELLTVSHITGVTRRSEKPEVTMFMAESLEGYKKCRRDDLIINTMWAWMGALGISGSDGIVSPGYNVYRFRQKALPKFFDLLYRTPQYITEFTRWSKGVWESRLRLYPFEFLQILTAVPPLEEQQAIVDAVERETGGQQKAIATLETSISKLAEYRSALIFAAVTGQIDVRTYRPQEAAVLCQ
jgi:type I restriction enzyme, S subunit